MVQAPAVCRCSPSLRVAAVPMRPMIAAPELVVARAAEVQRQPSWSAAAEMAAPVAQSAPARASRRARSKRAGAAVAAVAAVAERRARADLGFDRLRVPAFHRRK